jgi:hypothetical protein
MNGAFRLMEFAEFKPVAYPESETSSLFLERPEEIRAYRRILAPVADTALGEGQSREDPHRPALAVPTPAWQTFLTTLPH